MDSIKDPLLGTSFEEPTPPTGPKMPKLDKRTIGIAAAALGVLLLGIGSWWLMRSASPEAPIEEMTARERTGDPTQREDTWVLDIPRNDVLIRMNDGAYFPNNLTAETGMTIAFANEDTDMDYQPISESHPELFDVLTPMPPGSFWSFHVEEPGTYTFTDVLHPSISGQIRVSAPQE